MNPGHFGLGFMAVVLLTYAKSQFTEYWVPIEFSFFLIFLIIRSSEVPRALLMTFILSISLDLIFQTEQVKGLGAIGQLLMVYLIIHAKQRLLPNYSDLVLTVSFAIFYIGNYYIYRLLAGSFDIYARPYPLVSVLFFALFHMAIFGAILVVLVRFQRGK